MPALTNSALYILDEKCEKCIKMVADLSLSFCLLLSLSLAFYPSLPLALSLSLAKRDLSIDPMV